MDAGSLSFADSSFDNIICLEAVFHFHTRERFLQQAYRILKPRGALVLTDILLTDWGKRRRLWWVDEENAALSDLQAYYDLCRRVGFQEVQIVDATRECWERYYTNLARYCFDKLEKKEFGLETLNKIAVNIFRKIPATRTYMLVGARKS
jgi:ubiquinone/menaquinone biosynthesis C-methylase UbiE